MFTFGREHEKKCAEHYLRDPDSISLIHDVIDAAHDLLEGLISEQEIRPILERAFIEGGSGVWEQTETWIRNLIGEYPSLAAIWGDLSKHATWKVRWRVACVLDRMPVDVVREIGEVLKTDKSKKVREFAEDRLASLDL